MTSHDKTITISANGGKHHCYPSARKCDAYFGFNSHLSATEMATNDEAVIKAKRPRVILVPGTHLAVTQEVQTMRMWLFIVIMGWDHTAHTHTRIFVRNGGKNNGFSRLRWRVNSSRLSLIHRTLRFVCLLSWNWRHALACWFTIGCPYLLYDHLILTTSQCCPLASLFASSPDCNRCLSAVPLRAVFHYVSSAAEDTDFCSVGAGLHRLSAFHPEDVYGEVRPQSTRPLTFPEHGERERSDRDTRGRNY